VGTGLLAVLIIAQARADIVVTDFAGREVRLPMAAQRIVALAPHIAENIYSAGAGGKLVGVVSYSNYPPAATALPVVGSFNAFSLEQIIALQPDLVVLWGSGNGTGALAALERLGIAVYVSELRELQDIPDSIRRLGQLAGTRGTSDPEAVRIEAALRDLRNIYQQAEPVSVFYEIWNEPLQTINGSHLISQAIALCGGRNIFADVAALAPRVSLESVLAQDPDAIIASGMGEARPEWLDHWRDYPSLSAARNDHLFFINPDHLQRPTARILNGITTLCAQLDSVRKNPRLR
tara:strand:+ start:337939 stop:338814 length:876 start_codon:yes stop_codon:yes gene_type:complete